VVVDGADVYAIRLERPQEVKLSLHRDGSWQFSNTQQYWADKGKPNRARHVVRWQRPRADVSGHTLAARLMFAEPFLPAPGVIRFPEYEVDEWVPVIPNGTSQVSLMISAPDAPEPALTFEGGLPANLLWRASLQTGEVLSVHAASGPMAKPFNRYYVERETSRIARRHGSTPGYYCGTLCIAPGSHGGRSFLEAYWRVI